MRDIFRIYGLTDEDILEDLNGFAIQEEE